jgi:NAD-dependent dihydropyrimidine dehydrogenase PreA subunit
VRVEHDPERCIDCGACVKACPMGAITLHKGKKRL